MIPLNPNIDKLPPQNIEAEQSVLGAIILDNEALPKAMEILDGSEDFYKEAHKKIYKAMLDLFEKGEPIDIITLSSYLTKNGELEKIGGIHYLSLLVNNLLTSANIKYHCKIVREKALLRNLLNTSMHIISKIYEDDLDADEMIDYAEKKIFDIAEKRIKTSFANFKDLVKDTFRIIENLYNKKEIVTGVPSGFKDLDEKTCGFQKGDLIIIGGRPAMGKTAFALNIAQHVAINMRVPVAIFSLEMTKEQLVLRMLCSEGMVSSSNIRKGFLSKEDKSKLINAAARLAEAPIFIDDSSGITVLEIRAKARRLKLEYKDLGLIIIDYLQLMRSRGSFERREQEISDISRSLKALAKELKVPVIALSQLNRGVEQRPNKRPVLADLRESGAIEQDADVIIFLYRESAYNKNNITIKNKAEILLEKQRNGPTGVIPLTYLADYTRFVDFIDVPYDIESHDFEEEVI
ncbi:MAG: replicative DNA helicase [Thermodesulfovibrionales bacterium]|nr:replicative DNA helicase [Thermodesulfovibrionales bacterium]